MQSCNLTGNKYGLAGVNSMALLRSRTVSTIDLAGTMSSQVKPIKVWGASGPNPPKVAMVLKELNLPANVVPYPLSDVNKPEYTAINPNGRLPAIQDPNTGITLWESGAILDDIVQTYDVDQRLSWPQGTAEFWHTKQWLFSKPPERDLISFKQPGSRSSIQSIYLLPLSDIPKRSHGSWVYWKYT